MIFGSEWEANYSLRKAYMVLWKESCFVLLCCSFLIILIKLLTSRGSHYLCHVDLIDFPIQFYRTPRESISAFSELHVIQFIYIGLR
jgi:fumarate reductase subunit C